VLFYTLLLAASRRLARFDSLGRSAVLSLCAVSIAATVVYNALDFAIGHASRDPAMAIAIKLRMMLTAGDVWDIVFPLLAIVWLRRPQARAVFGS
jgi:hypothetical protein